jgi:hypothetical protein
MKDKAPTHTLRGISLFSFLAALFGALIGLVIAGLLALDPWNAPSRQGTVIGVAIVSFVSFAATINWLLYWYFDERFGETVGSWQALPKWLRALSGKGRQDSTDAGRDARGISKGAGPATEGHQNKTD